MLRKVINSSLVISSRISSYQTVTRRESIGCFTPRFTSSTLAQRGPHMKSKLTKVTEAEYEGLQLTFEDGSKSDAPFVWLRDNCQCSSCFDSTALGRKICMDDFDFDCKPNKVQSDGSSLSITWNDSHRSVYNSEWLREKALGPAAKEKLDRLIKIPPKPWGKDFTPKTFDFERVMKEDGALLRWIKTMEEDGVTLVQNAMLPGDSANFCDHVGFAKNTHYGRISPVYIRKEANNVAFQNAKLGLHTDFTYYQYQPGIVLLHAIRQHKGKGGESVISDGLHSAQFLKKNHPKAFETLTTHEVYFWDKGTANISAEKDFYKVFKSPTIRLDVEGQVEVIRFNNQVRHSFLPSGPSEVKELFDAFRLFNGSLYRNAISFKIKDGEVLVLDNLRCLHGREKFEDSSERYLEACSLDWDEVRCRRRLLTEKIDSNFS